MAFSGLHKQMNSFRQSRQNQFFSCHHLITIHTIHLIDTSAEYILVGLFLGPFLVPDSCFPLLILQSLVPVSGFQISLTRQLPVSQFQILVLLQVDSSN